MSDVRSIEIERIRRERDGYRRQLLNIEPQREAINTYADFLAKQIQDCNERIAVASIIDRGYATPKVRMFLVGDG